MFYAHFVLSKKGPLARIWLAAHWDKKLTKAHVFETNIDSSVEAIIQPKVKLALRTSGHLLLGVVRIYSRKAKYLLADCNEAFVKIKMAFRPGVVDLPEENREAAVATITLPETFHDFETTMADLNDIDVQAQFAVNQSRPEEITMREDLGNIALVGDDGFGELGGFGAGDNMLQDVHMDDTLYVRNPDSVLPADAQIQEDQEQRDKPMDLDFNAPAVTDGLGDGLPDYEGPVGMDDDDDDSDHDDGGDFGGGMDTELFGGDFGETGGLFEEPPVPDVTMPSGDGQTQDQNAQGATGEQPTVPGTSMEPSVTAAASRKEGDDTTHLPDATTASTLRDQTTLIPNESEAFALEPIDVTTLGTERKAKRRRKLIIDEQKGIASETMKVQLSDTSDIVTTLDLAPPTKKLMHWKETGGVEKLFALPGRPLVSKRAIKLFNKNLVTRSMAHLDEDQDDLELDQHPATVPEEELPPPPPVTATKNTSQVSSFVEQPSIREREIGRKRTTEELEPPALEPPSLLEDMSVSEKSRPSVSMVADASSVFRPEDSLQQPEQVSAPPVEESEAQSPPVLGNRRESSEDDDMDDIFDDGLPSIPEPDGSSTGGSAADEEEQEEKRWNKRTQQMSYILNRSFTRGETTVGFSELILRNNRKQVASKFYTLLVLKKMQAVDVVQNTPFGEITISQGPKFEVVE